jgi:hypothetical protein
MRALPVYLTDEQYQAVRDAADRAGVPMTEVVRRAIEERLVNDRPPTDLSSFVGVAEIDDATDIGRDKDRMLMEAIGAVRGRGRAVRTPRAS